MKRRTVFLILIILLIGAVFLIYKITTEKTTGSNATTSFTVTTRRTINESTRPNGDPSETTFSDTSVTTRTTTDAPRTASTTNTTGSSTEPTTSITNPPTSATNATSATSLSSSTTSSPSVTTVTSQITTKSSVTTTASTSSTSSYTTTTANGSTSENVPTVTEITTKITTTDPPWTRKSTTETDTSEAPKTTSEQTITEIETTEDVRTSEVTTTVDTTTTHATDISCEKFNYVARDADTGVACVRANMTIRINLRYVTNYYRTNEATLKVPQEAKTSGVCGEKTAEMTLSWKDTVSNQANDGIKDNKVTFLYAHDDNKYFLDSISIDVHLDNDIFPNAQHKRIKEDTTGGHLFSTSMKHGAFIRQSGTKIDVGDRVNVLISDISLIAFAECSEDNSRIDDDYAAAASVKFSAIISGIIGVIVLILIIFLLIRRKKKKNAAKREHNSP